MARRKGAGSVVQKGKYFYIRFQSNGKSKFTRLKSSTREAAELEASKYNATAEARSAEEFALFIARARKVIEESEAIGLQDAFEAFRGSALRPACGTEQMARHKAHWLEFISALPPSIKKTGDITAGLVENFFSALDYSARSFNARLKSLRLIWRILERDRPNPFKDIPLKKEIPAAKKEFDRETLQAVFRAVDGEYPLKVFHRDEMRVLFRVLAYTGMRLKDGCLLNWKSVGRDYIVVIPEKTKVRTGGRPVKVPIHPELAAVLPKRSSGPVLPVLARAYESGRSNVIKPALRVIDWAVVKWRMENGELKIKKRSKHASGVARPERQKEYGLHSFRHGFITFCAEAGVPLDQVKDIVGQHSVAVTRIYVHYSEETRKKVIAALPGY